MIQRDDLVSLYQVTCWWLIYIMGTETDPGIGHCFQLTMTVVIFVHCDTENLSLNISSEQQNGRVKYIKMVNRFYNIHSNC